MPDAPVTFTTGPETTRSRNGVSTPSGSLLFDGKEASSATYKTEADGTVKVHVTSPNGIGVKTPITAHSGSIDSNEQDVIFRIITSPDDPDAHMWGHMAKSIIVGGVEYFAPELSTDSASVSVREENNEAWVSGWAVVSFDSNCSARHPGASGPSSADLTAVANSGITAGNGWPLGTSYQSTTLTTDGKVEVVSLVSGYIGSQTTPRGYITCKK